MAAVPASSLLAGPVPAVGPATAREQRSVAHEVDGAREDEAAFLQQPRQIDAQPTAVPAPPPLASSQPPPQLHHHRQPMVIRPSGTTPAFRVHSLGSTQAALAMAAVRPPGVQQPQAAPPARSPAAVAYEDLVRRWLQRLTTEQLRELLVNYDVHIGKRAAQQQLVTARRRLAQLSSSATTSDGRARARGRAAGVKQERPGGAAPGAVGRAAGTAVGGPSSRKPADGSKTTGAAPATVCSWTGCGATFPSLTLMLDHIGEVHERPS